jgi:arsenate reductase-like glutaredoxin family protein
VARRFEYAPWHGRGHDLAQHRAHLGLDADDYVTPEAVADLLVEHPRLMPRPVLIKGHRAIIGRPKERLRPFVE